MLGLNYPSFLKEICSQNNNKDEGHDAFENSVNTICFLWDL